MADVSRKAESNAGPDLIAEFCLNVTRINNGAMVEIGRHLATMPSEYRARFIERCASMAGAAAETLAAPDGNVPR